MAKQTSPEKAPQRQPLVKPEPHKTSAQRAECKLADEFVEARLTGLLKELQDPRQACKVVYPLPHLLALSMAAMLCLHDNFPLMAEWARENGPWLLNEMGMEALAQMPSHDCFRTTFGLLKHTELEGLMRSAVAAHRAGSLARLVLIDGKALRYTYTADADEGGRLMVLNAYDASTGVVLGSQLVPGTTSEVGQLPSFIDTLVLRNSIVSLDAAGSHRPVCRAIAEQGADVVCVIRDNQPSLHHQIACFFEGWGIVPSGSIDGVDPLKLATRADVETFHMETKSKGRSVRYRLTMSRWIDLVMENQEPWSGVKSIAVMERERVDEKGHKHRTLTFLLSSLNNAKTMLVAVKDRWKIENSLHWVLDVTYGEDAARTLEQNAAANLATLRRMSLNATKLCPTTGSMKSRRLKCCGSRDYLAKVMRAFIVDSEA
jgi:predicted transposase YbfD/YdcC